MHGVLFQLKRSYHRTLGAGQRLCRAVARHLTPARFDLLRVVSRWMLGHYTPRGVVPSQAALARALGVSAVTVSKMLHRLEELRIIRRWKAPEDKRCKRVSLTRRGAAILRRATRCIVEPGVLQALLQAGFGAPHEGPAAEAGTRVAALYRELLFLARGLRDRAILLYPLPMVLPRKLRSTPPSPSPSPSPSPDLARARPSTPVVSPAAPVA